MDCETVLGAWGRVVFVALPLASAACASVAPPMNEGPVRQVCEEPRSEVCTQDYRPVCAELRSSVQKTYSNGCAACSDADVVSHVEGACP